MSTQNEDVVEEILKGLKRVDPMSEFEIRKFEKFIDKQAADYKKSRNTSRFRIPASIAASFMLVFGVAFFLTNQTSTVSTKSDKPPTESQVSGTSESDSSQGKSSASRQPAGQNNFKNEDSNIQVFGDKDNTGGKNGTVAIYMSNLDYSDRLMEIRELVHLSNKPGKISTLSLEMQQCAIKQGVASTLLAVDRGYFQGQRVSALFSGPNKSNMKIILVDSNCEIVAEL